MMTPEAIARLKDEFGGVRVEGILEELRRDRGRGRLFLRNAFLVRRLLILRGQADAIREEARLPAVVSGLKLPNRQVTASEFPGVAGKASTR